MAQTVSGRITSATDGSPLPGVSLLVKGTSSGTTTDSDGRYSLAVPDAQTSILTLSFIGFKTQELQVNNRTTINVAMEEDVTLFDEIVVIGYGTQKRSDLTGAVGSVSQDKLRERPAPSLNQALSGKITGVQVNTNSGRPGGKSNVRIRGFSSINSSNNPLYVVDGVQ
ncbi:MAG TPA: carboxypeptidase-like regulatory domain-containing protein, partial [Chryseosolibacter sp.]